MDTNEDNDNDGNDDGLIIDLQAEIRLQVCKCLTHNAQAFAYFELVIFQA